MYAVCPSFLRFVVFCQFPSPLVVTFFPKRVPRVGPIGQCGMVHFRVGRQWDSLLNFRKNANMKLNILIPS